MTDFQPRIVTSFESIGGGTVLTFSRADYEWQSSQALIVPAVALVGANYVYDQLGVGAAIKDVGLETLAFVVFEDDPKTVDDTVDELVSKCLLIGKGKLFTTNKNGTKRWAYARALSMPPLRWSAGDIFTNSCSGLPFRRESDWYAETPTSTSDAVASSPTDITVTNSGSQRVYNAVIKLTGTFNDFTIANSTNDYSLSYAGNPGTTANDVVYIDCGANRVYRSYDAGVTWSDDDASVTRGSGQAQLMRLDPGANAIEITDSGSPDATIEFIFNPA